MSAWVQRSCEDGGSSESTVVARTDEDENLEYHPAELHSSSIGCKQKFASDQSAVYMHEHKGGI
jgi:hypothetical protein